MKKKKYGLSCLYFSLSISLPCCSTLCERSSLCTPSPLLFFLSVPLFLCFVLSLSLSPPLSSLCTVVCRHAGISGPQNDRPNLSALAPVTKDGRPGSVCACDWCTSELLPMWLVITCLSTALVLLAKVGISVFCLYKVQFSCVICDSLVTVTLPLFCFSPVQFGLQRHMCLLQAAVFVSSCVCVN